MVKHLAGPGHQADPHKDNREWEVLFKHIVGPRYLPPEWKIRMLPTEGLAKWSFRPHLVSFAPQHLSAPASQQQGPIDAFDLQKRILLYPFHPSPANKAS